MNFANNHITLQSDAYLDREKTLLLQHARRKVAPYKPTFAPPTTTVVFGRECKNNSNNTIVAPAAPTPAVGDVKEMMDTATASSNLPVNKKRNAEADPDIRSQSPDKKIRQNPTPTEPTPPTNVSKKPQQKQLRVPPRPKDLPPDPTEFLPSDIPAVDGPDKPLSTRK